MKKLLLILSLAFAISTSAQYTKLLDFDFTNGGSPYGSLISDGTSLYGMTLWGGVKGNGVIFKIQPDGSGYTKLLDFIGTNGASPNGSLISDGTYLYGMTQQGGANAVTAGVIFKIKPDGSGYTKLLDFDGTNGGMPQGSLISDGIYLYGMTVNGGANGNGIIFKIQPDGNGYTNLLDFNGNNGKWPHGNLIFDGTYLYGMTGQGGSNDWGVIFKIKPDGSGYTKLLDFDGANGRYPCTSLIIDGTYLYGMTEGGGANGNGIIFKIKFDGSGYTKLLDFDGTNGAGPYGALISDGTYLYGMTNKGGANNWGVIFKIKPDGNGYAKLLDFNGNNGKWPYYGSLISDGIHLYGMVAMGGANGIGVIYKFEMNATGITELEKSENISIYPNPSNGLFNVQCLNFEIENITVVNALGEIIYQTNNKQQLTTIDIFNQPSGIYFVEIKSEKEKVFKIIVKE